MQAGSAKQNAVEHAESDVMPVLDPAFKRAHSFYFIPFLLLKSRCHVKQKLPTQWAHRDSTISLLVF